MVKFLDFIIQVSKETKHIKEEYSTFKFQILEQIIHPIIINYPI